MKAPPRLLEDGTPFERELLGSARLDVGSPRRLRRTVAAMAATVTVAGGARAAASVLSGNWLRGMLSAKWLGIALVCVTAGAVVISSLSVVRSRAAQKLEPMTAAAVQVSKAALGMPATAPAPASPPSAAAPSASPSTAEAPPPRPTHRVVARGSRPSALASETAGASARAPSSSLLAEIAALARARAAMQRGEPQDALRALDAFERTFPGSVLAVEASVLRVDALVGAGDQGAAVALARRTLAAAPGSPHAPHLRAVIERSNDVGP